MFLYTEGHCRIGLEVGARERARALRADVLNNCRSAVFRRIVTKIGTRVYYHTEMVMVDSFMCRHARCAQPTKNINGCRAAVFQPIVTRTISTQVCYHRETIVVKSVYRKGHGRIGLQVGAQERAAH